jgi:hypothetical protein
VAPILTSCSRAGTHLHCSGAVNGPPMGNSFYSRQEACPDIRTTGGAANSGQLTNDAEGCARRLPSQFNWHPDLCFGVRPSPLGMGTRSSLVACPFVANLSATMSGPIISIPICEASRLIWWPFQGTEPMWLMSRFPTAFCGEPTGMALDSSN